MNTELNTEESEVITESQENVTNNTLEDKPMLTMEQVTKIAESEQAYVKGLQTINTMQKNKDRLLSHFEDDLPTSTIEDKVAKFKTLEELGDFLSTPENINSFFTDEEGTVSFVSSDGENAVTEEEDLEFKKGFLLYIRQMQFIQDEIDEVMSEFNKETSKMNEEMNSSMRDFVSEYMDYIISTKKQIEQSDSPNKEEALHDLNFIESGLTFSEIIKVYEEHPSILENTLKDSMSEHFLFGIGKQYKVALKKAHTNTSLITFLTESPKTSFEAMYLPKNAYREGYEGLFIFSLIRFFSKQYWSSNVKKMHISIVVILQRFIKDEMDDATKDAYIENITNYLNKFYEVADRK